jgi:hypothetical protein
MEYAFWIMFMHGSFVFKVHGSFVFKVHGSFVFKVHGSFVSEKKTKLVQNTMSWFNKEAISSLASKAKKYAEEALIASDEMFTEIAESAQNEPQPKIKSTSTIIHLNS